MFVKDMLELYPEPRPHINTLSTQVRTLEKDGFLGHETFGNGYRYYPIVGKEDFRSDSLSGLVNNFFGNSYLSAVSSLVREEKISLEELEQLVRKLKKEQSEQKD
jgi:predicted transcriptional regulator